MSAQNGIGLLVALGAGLWAFRRSLAGRDPRYGPAPVQYPGQYPQGDISEPVDGGFDPFGGSDPFNEWQQPAQRVPTTYQPTSFDPVGANDGFGDPAQTGGAVSHDVDVLARTIWGEARGEGRAGMQAIANVIMNRVRKRGWPNSAAKVAQQRLQFSVWNANDPNNPKIRAVTESDREFRIALALAGQAVAGQLQDITGGADHYHPVTFTARWDDPAKLSATIGNHVFYNLRG